MSSSSSSTSYFIGNSTESMVEKKIRLYNNIDNDTIFDGLDEDTQSSFIQPFFFSFDINVFIAALSNLLLKINFDAFSDLSDRSGKILGVFNIANELIQLYKSTDNDKSKFIELIYNETNNEEEKQSSQTMYMKLLSTIKMLQDMYSYLGNINIKTKKYAPGNCSILSSIIKQEPTTTKGKQSIFVDIPILDFSGKLINAAGEVKEDNLSFIEYVEYILFSKASIFSSVELPDDVSGELILHNPDGSQKKIEMKVQHKNYIGYSNNFHNSTARLTISDELTQKKNNKVIDGLSEKYPDTRGDIVIGVTQLESGGFGNSNPDSKLIDMFHELPEFNDPLLTTTKIYDLKNSSFGLILLFLLFICDQLHDTKRLANALKIKYNDSNIKRLFYLKDAVKNIPDDGTIGTNQSAGLILSTTEKNMLLTLIDQCIVIWAGSNNAPEKNVLEAFEAEFKKTSFNILDSKTNVSNGYVMTKPKKFLLDWNVIFNIIPPKDNREFNQSNAVPSIRGDIGNAGTYGDGGAEKKNNYMYLKNETKIFKYGIGDRYVEYKETLQNYSRDVDGEKEAGFDFTTTITNFVNGVEENPIITQTHIFPYKELTHNSKYYASPVNLLSKQSLYMKSPLNDPPLWNDDTNWMNLFDDVLFSNKKTFCDYLQTFHGNINREKIGENMYGCVYSIDRSLDDYKVTPQPNFINNKICHTTNDIMDYVISMSKRIIFDNKDYDYGVFLTCSKQNRICRSCDVLTLTDLIIPDIEVLLPVVEPFLEELSVEMSGGTKIMSGGNGNVDFEINSLFKTAIGEKYSSYYQVRGSELELELISDDIMKRLIAASSSETEIDPRETLILILTKGEIFSTILPSTLINSPNINSLIVCILYIAFSNLILPKDDLNITEYARKMYMSIMTDDEFICGIFDNCEWGTFTESIAKIEEPTEQGVILSSNTDNNLYLDIEVPYNINTYVNILIVHFRNLINEHAINLLLNNRDTIPISEWNNLYFNMQFNNLYFNYNTIFKDKQVDIQQYLSQHRTSSQTRDIRVLYTKYQEPAMKNYIQYKNAIKYQEELINKYEKLYIQSNRIISSEINKFNRSVSQGTRGKDSDMFNIAYNVQQNIDKDDVIHINIINFMTLNRIIYECIPNCNNFNQTELNVRNNTIVGYNLSQKETLDFVNRLFGVSLTNRVRPDIVHVLISYINVIIILVCSIPELKLIVMKKNELYIDYLTVKAEIEAVSANISDIESEAIRINDAINTALPGTLLDFLPLPSDSLPVVSSASIPGRKSSKGGSIKRKTKKMLRNRNTRKKSSRRLRKFSRKRNNIHRRSRRAR